MRRNRKSRSPKATHSHKAETRLPKGSYAARERSLKALRDMRQGDSLSKAARENGVKIRTVKRYLGSALIQDRPGGRYRATKSDRLIRYLQIPGQDGPREVTVRGSRKASEFANYKAAINRLLRGDRSAMAPWRGKKIAGIELITDPKVLIEQAHAETLPYSLYRSLAGAAA